MLARKAEYLGYVGTRPAVKPVGQARHRGHGLSASAVRIVFAIAIIICFSILCTALSAYRTSYSYTLAQKKQHVQQLQRENDMLRVDLADLETPARIYTLATQQLGMVMPSQSLYSSARSEAVNGGTHR